MMSICDKNYPDPKIEITSKVEIKEENEHLDLQTSESIEIKVEPLWETAGLCELSGEEDDDDENSFSNPRTSNEQACYGEDKMISNVSSCTKLGEEKKIITIKMENTYSTNVRESTSSLSANSIVKSCSSNESYNCQECEMLFNSKSDLDLHICDVRNGVTDNSPSLKDDSSISTDNENHRPVQMAHKTNVFKCSMCNQEFSRNSNLARHMQTFHDKVKTFSCFLCQRDFSRKSDVARHILNVHEKFRPYKCQICGHCSSTKCHLANHIKLSHENVKEFKCSICDKDFSRKGDLSRHILTVHEKMKEFKCSLCEKDFSLKCHLSRHIKNVHKLITDGNCSLNNLDRPTINVKNNVSGHSQINCEREESIKCHLNRNNSTIKCHSSSYVPPTIHDKLASLKCSVCNKVFTRKKDLSRHVQGVHYKTKPHKCSMCHKYFSWQSDLTRHKRTVHENIRPYKCSFCNKSFGKNSHLSRHLKGVHKKSKP